MHDTSRLHRHHTDELVAIDTRRRTVALMVLCLCALTTAVDITITNVALPFIGRDLHASVAGLQLVIDAYNIVLAGLLILGGGLADRFGRRTIFLGGYALFGVSCLLAAFSPTTGALIGARVVMGVGAAAVIAPALAIVATMYPPAERARAIAVWSVFGASGLAIGPIVGGLLLAHFWWGSVFLVNVPFVAFGVVAGLFVIPQSRKPDDGHLDVVGALLSVAGLGLLLLGVIEGPEQGWLSAPVLLAVGAGAALIVTFVHRELTTPDPLLDVRVLGSPAVAAGSAALFVVYVVLTGMLFLLPQWLQDVQGESIVTVGLLLVPFAAMAGFGSMRSTAVVQRVGSRSVVSGGLAICALGVAGLAAFLNVGVAATVVASAVVGLGLAGEIAPASTVVMNDLPESKAGDGSSLNMVSRFVGGAVGVAVVGSLLSSVYKGRLGHPTAGLSSARAAAAKGSLQRALEIAAGLPRAAGDQLASAARDAFDSGARIGYLAIAVLAAVAAIWVSRALRPRQAAHPPGVDAAVSGAPTPRP